ncbi:thioredoxin domain-containing protein [Amycolatopsis sp. NPDC050768]|uniref:DsbA family protein n=1 Tax=Amycolatopsis sp. NPDC050768 TaxID=3154839 RepID=UPI00340C3CC6
MARNKRNPVTTGKGLSANTWTTIAVIVVAVLVIGGVLVFNHRDEPAPSSGTVAADVLRHRDSHTLSQADNGAVTVVEFLDYQCPVCEAYYQNVTSSIEHDYAGRITFVTRNFPLPMHPLAVPAARAAEAAALQGKYQQMYEKLYGDYPTWALAADGKNVSDDTARAQARFDSYAEDLGLDLGRFHSDMASKAVQARIDQGQADGNEAGVTGTPTIFVNGSKFSPAGTTYAQVARQLRGQLDRALAS